MHEGDRVVIARWSTICEPLVPWQQLAKRKGAELAIPVTDAESAGPRGAATIARRQSELQLVACSVMSMS